MNKIKYIIGILIVIVGMLCFNLLNREYFQKEDKRNINAQYLALDAETALKNITIKKEMIEPKEYYTAGDEIKYKFTVTNNNSETVKVNVLDNISNLEQMQRNLVLKSAKCNDESVTIINNQINKNDIEIASKGTYTCEVTAKTKDSYPEGKVNSKVKIYIDDEDNYIKDGFTYIVRDSILDIIVNKLDRYYYYWKEPVYYEVQIKNISSEYASGKVVIVISPFKTLRYNESYDSNYTYTLSGASKNLVDNSKLKSVKCYAPDGKVCVADETQNIHFTIAGINPNETVKLRVKLSNYFGYSSAISLNTSIVEYEDDKVKKSTKKDNGVAIVNDDMINKGNILASLDIIDSEGNLVYDFNNLEYNKGKANIYLNYDFYRLDSSYGFTDNTTVKYNNLKLESNIEYIESSPPTFSNCSNQEYNIGLDDDSLYYISIGCVPNSTNKGNAKVPLTVTNRLLNGYACFDAWSSYSGVSYYDQYNGNRYCVGTKLKVRSAEATQKDNNINIKLSVENVTGHINYGRAENVRLTYKYENGLKIDKKSLGEDATINESNRTVTWTIPLIRLGETISVSLKAENTGGLNKLKISGALEGEEYEDQSIVIVNEGSTYLKGDWNLNGTVNINDAIYARKYIARLGDVVLPPAQVYDLNGDNNPTISDLVLLRKLISEGKN